MRSAWHGYGVGGVVAGGLGQVHQNRVQHILMQTYPPQNGARQARIGAPVTTCGVYCVAHPYRLPSQRYLRYARQNPISRRPQTEESTQAKEHSAGPHEVSSTMVSLSTPALLGSANSSMGEAKCTHYTTQLDTYVVGTRLVGASGVLQSSTRPRQETVSHLRIALYSNTQVDRRRPYEYNRGTVKSARTANGRVTRPKMAVDTRINAFSSRTPSGLYHLVSMTKVGERERGIGGRFVTMLQLRHKPRSGGRSASYGRPGTGLSRTKRFCP
ncbi:hypothetical protein CKAH01_12127 [Colletotrichum kahawae]|uniref:Uncharacterized protein n=1 Tax=Colletotrichum kahawae TaxID=34407 RepID=A0AAE0DD64_COLKA|nr:hypothetical protein CKAH01_12127 [Colletotrichum kahawae]